MRYHYSRRFLTYSMARSACLAVRLRATCGGHDVLASSAPRAVSNRSARDDGSVTRCRRSHEASSLPRALLARACCPVRPPEKVAIMLGRDPIRGHRQAGSLTGAVHLSKNNAGVPRPAQRGQKPRVEQKGKCWLDPDAQ
ncbi:hypothetical protein PPYR_02569 [Photinus pyralis]|uniref:Uncharacterized protein n=2 Tax=Photinus pyralis TaxID=7054 RepID=A0A5N4B7L6_PHOPY|nr:hypothetical protein PPYR_15691 [Photinus pyralis]KAB0805599.1 hypothetical protein PPYR_02569 [Photinus pyralis]